MKEITRGNKQSEHTFITNKKLHSIALRSAVIILFLILITSTVSATTLTSNVVATNYKCDSWSNEQYPLIQFFGDNYVTLRSNTDPIWESHVNKFAELILDTKSIYTLKTGEKLDLGRGYSLQARQADVDGKKIQLELDKDGQYFDDQIVSTGSGDYTWTYTCMVWGIKNVPVLKVHFKQINQGATGIVAQIDGLWLIDYANAEYITIGDQFENLTLTKIINGVDASNLGSLILEPVAAGPETNNMSTKKIIVPTSKRNYMVLDPEAQKQEAEQWNNTPILPFKHFMTFYSALSGYNSQEDFSILNYIPDYNDRSQGNSGNCWIWAGTACLEASHTIYNGYNDRLSTQFVDSGISGWTSSKGGFPADIASFYNNIGYAVPWTNSNAYYQDGNLAENEVSHVPFNSIAKIPNYQINKSMQAYKIEGDSDDAYISQIKGQILDGNPVLLIIHAPNSNDMENYFKSAWDNGPSDQIFDFSNEWGGADGADSKLPGHLMDIVGYHDDPTSPADSYWIVLNSWGTPNGHRDGTFRMTMHPAKGYDASFDRNYWFTGNERVLEFFVYSYNNSHQAFIQEPTKPINLKVISTDLSYLTGLTHVHFQVEDWGHPYRGTLHIGNKVIFNDYKSNPGDSSFRSFETDLDPGSYNTFYTSYNGVGNGGPIYLKSPLIIKSIGLDPAFSYASSTYCPPNWDPMLGRFNPSENNSSYHPPSPTDPINVVFTDNSNYLPNKWHWDFGDGNTSDEQNPNHIYPHSGSYTVTLTVWDKWEGPKTLTKVINAYWTEDCSKWHPPIIDSKLHKPVSLPVYPPKHIWKGELTFPEQNLFGDKVINAQVSVTSLNHVYMPIMTTQNDVSMGINDQLYNSGNILRGQAYNESTLISPEKSYDAKAINVEANVSPAQNITLMYINDSFNHLENMFVDKTSNTTTFGSRLDRMRGLTPTFIIQPDTPTFVIQPNKSSKIKYTIDTNGLDPGYYKFVVTLKDPNTHEVITQEPVFFGVLGIPNIQVTPKSLDLGTLNIGQVNQKQFTINNTGNANLSYNISIPYEYSASSLQGIVPAFGSKIITLSVDTVYAAQEPYFGKQTVVITSNSSTNATINIPVTYKLNVPCASLVSLKAPSSLNASDTYKLNITMHNKGSIPWFSSSTLGVLDVGDAGKFVSTDASPVPVVYPGENATYQLILHAPSTPGDYMLALEMYYRDANNVKWFFGWPVFIGITVTNKPMQYTGQKPVANFSSNVTSGNSPLNVTFFDQSSGSPTTWNWSFGDKGTSNLQNPTHKYPTAGNYTINLTVSNAAGSNTVTKANYIKVTSLQKPVANFSSNVTSGNTPLNVAFTDKSSGSPTIWNWSFGDKGTSNLQNPTHKYPTAGNYTVNLTVSNAAGSNTVTKANYIKIR